MQTFLTNSPEKAADFIKKGCVVAFPTETVYGLGANVFDERAIRKIFTAKNRPSDNPLIAHIGDLEQIELLASEVNQTAKKLIDAFFPSPLTIVLKKTQKVPMIATANLETIGVRMPNNDLALEFLRACKTPVVAPSANLSGKPSPTTWQAVYEDLNSRIDCILQGEQTNFGLESTVVDCTSEIPLILRSGAITLEQLQKVVPKTQIYRPKENEIAKSPGLKHRHYSPRAKVELVQNIAFDAQGSSSFIGLNLPKQSFDSTKICSSIDEYARELFAFFRECDNKNIAIIYCEVIEEKGIGVALMDRLRRASEK
jgi:L-threonylcarbamoyladenylate synthase